MISFISNTYRKSIRSIQSLNPPEAQLCFQFLHIGGNVASTVTFALDSKAAFFDIDIFSATVHINPIQSAAATHDTTVNRVAF